MTTELQSTTFANEIPSDIRLSGGDTVVLLIDTDKYSGNFEREMAAYVIGAYDEDRHHGANQADEFEEACGDNPALSAMCDKVCSVSHAEYGEVTNTIWATPGLLNTGYGVFFVDDGTKNGSPAYQTVAIFLDEALTADELELVKQRAIEYGAKRTNFSAGPDPVVVTGVRQLTFSVQVKTKRTVTVS